jgi:hypothetical protein
LRETEKAMEYFLKASVGLDEPTSAMFYNDQPPEMISEIISKINGGI